jgi:hypothetical protein
MINLLEDLSRGKEILNCHTEISFDYIPRLLEENRGISIRTRGFIITNTEEGFLDSFI